MTKVKEDFSMPINLSKGQKVDLTKGNPGLRKIMVGSAQRRMNLFFIRIWSTAAGQ